MQVFTLDGGANRSLGLKVEEDAPIDLYAFRSFFICYPLFFSHSFNYRKNYSQECTTCHAVIIFKTARLMLSCLVGTKEDNLSLTGM